MIPRGSEVLLRGSVLGHIRATTCPYKEMSTGGWVGAEQWGRMLGQVGFLHLTDLNYKKQLQECRNTLNMNS